MNSEDRRRRVAFLLLALAAVMAVSSAALAVEINLVSSDVAQIGGTPQVSVTCPANPCQVTRVTWTISGPPFRVTAVNVQWTPASSTGSYTVYVALYDNSGAHISGGSATQTGSSSSVTTNVSVSPPANPRHIYSVEIVIIQN